MCSSDCTGQSVVLCTAHAWESVDAGDLLLYAWASWPYSKSIFQMNLS